MWAERHNERVFTCSPVPLRAHHVQVGALSLILLALVAVGSAHAGQSPSVPGRGVSAEASNLRLVSQHTLDGAGDGGEGLVIQQRPNGQRLLYLAHEGQRTCVSVLDVTRPAAPRLIVQLPSPGPGTTRCNSLGLVGNTLVVANQTLNKGEKPAGMWVLDVSDLARVERAKTMQDLALSFFDTSGPSSRGAHCLWFVDGEFVHLATGMPDFDPTNPLDDQIYVIVDLRDPKQPREVGRWWYPGTWQRDTCLPACLPVRNAKFDTGYRPHQTEVFPERPDRSYVSYIDGGAFTLDISGLADVRAGRAARFTPTVVNHVRFSPPFPAWTHTFQPIFSRGVAIASDESTKDNCADSPKLVWLVDIRAESNPMVIGTAPLHADDGELCAVGGRFGAHNIHPNFPNATSANLKNTTVASWFNGGVRVYRLVDGPVGMPDAPARLEEIGYYIPARVPGATAGTTVPAQINHAIVDEHGLIYANDRSTGGLYILEYTGNVPLD
jgi:hypothetical protein